MGRNYYTSSEGCNSLNTFHSNAITGTKAIKLHDVNKRLRAFCIALL
jgi:hypothetical protein